MKVGPELREWLGDREKQRLARAQADAFANRWNESLAAEFFGPALSQLQDSSAETVAAAICELFAEDAMLDALVDRLAEALRANPFLEPSFRHFNSDIHNGLIVYEDANVSVAAGVTNVIRLAEKKNRNSGGAIAFSGQVDIFKFVRAGRARLSLWEAPRITAGFTAAQAGRCRRTGERVLRDGEVLVVDGRFQSFIIEHASANLVLLQATVKADWAPVAVEYDHLTGQYRGCSAADDSASRIQMITTLLRKLDCEAAFPAMAEFLAHPSFFVRWHVMRELLGLDAEAALPHLRRMAAGDPHPETRRAAGQVLERLERTSPGARKAA
jgi:hypothetical protein